MTAPRASSLRRGGPAILLLAGIAAYLNSFTVPLIFDDHDIIERNPSIRSIAGAFVPLGADGATVAGRPLVNVTLALNHALGGTSVFGYHAVNLALHLAATLALFGVVRRLLEHRGSQVPGTDPAPLAFAVALVWSLHPLQTAAVTYIAQRAEVLASLFYLLTFYSFLRAVGGERSRVQSRESRGREQSSVQGRGSRAGGMQRPPDLGRSTLDPKWSALAVACCLLGMASKEVMVSAPVMVLLLDRTFVAGSFRAAWRSRRGFYLGLAATWGLLGWLVLGTGGRGGTAGFGSGVTAWQYALTQCEAIVGYLRLAAWPHPLIFDRGIAVRSSLGEVILPALVVTALLAAVAWALWRRPIAGFLGALFFAVLAPSSSVVPVATQTVAEHRMYLPLAAVVAAALLALQARLGRRVVWVAAAWAAALGTITVARNRDYRSELSIWEDTVAKAPLNGRARGNLGKALSVAGREAEAVAALQEAVRLQPDLTSAHYNLGLIRFEAGDLDGARRAYETVLFYDPRYAEARLNLGAILLAQGQVEPARAQLELAVQEAPGLVEARVVLGNALAQAGRFADAAVQHQAAVALDPRSPIAHFNLANDLFQLRQPAGAEVHYRQALQLDPGNVEARFYLGLTLAAAGRLADGAAELERALAQRPDFGPAREALAQMRAALAAPRTP